MNTKKAPYAEPFYIWVGRETQLCFSTYPNKKKGTHLCSFEEPMEGLPESNALLGINFSSLS